jgi:hypothetical protein
MAKSQDNQTSNNELDQNTGQLTHKEMMQTVNKAVD